MEVSIDLALECMSEFASVMQENNLDPIHDAFTESVVFDTAGFASWLVSNNYLATTDKLRISFGIYTANAANELDVPQYEGRMTAFIWPVKDTTEYAPYNTGELVP